MEKDVKMVKNKKLVESTRDSGITVPSANLIAGVIKTQTSTKLITLKMVVKNLIGPLKKRFSRCV